MKVSVGEYQDWACIDYRPAIADLTPRVVLEHLPPGSTALDIGCNKGGVAKFLAQSGLNVLGIDINADAIEEARQETAGTTFSGTLDFRVADVLTASFDRQFDVVLLIRVLTCFPDVFAWESLLTRCGSLIRPDGYIYIHDFLLSPESENYGPRYEAGSRLGWRRGNFAVTAPAGDLLFVAHHHSEEEVDIITAPYQKVHFCRHASLSMNGNACRMFEFIGRRPS